MRSLALALMLALAASAFAEDTEETTDPKPAKPEPGAVEAVATCYSVCATQVVALAHAHRTSHPDAVPRTEYCIVTRNTIRAAQLCALACADIWLAADKPESRVRDAYRKDIKGEIDKYETSSCEDTRPLADGLYLR